MLHQARRRPAAWCWRLTGVAGRDDARSMRWASGLGQAACRGRSGRASQQVACARRTRSRSTSENRLPSQIVRSLPDVLLRLQGSRNPARPSAHRGSGSRRASRRCRGEHHQRHRVRGAACTGRYGRTGTARARRVQPLEVQRGEGSSPAAQAASGPPGCRPAEPGDQAADHDDGHRRAEAGVGAQAEIAIGSMPAPIAMVVMTIGGRVCGRRRAASQAFHAVLARPCDGVVDEQDRVLGGDAHQHDQADHRRHRQRSVCVTNSARNGAGHRQHQRGRGW